MIRTMDLSFDLYLERRSWLHSLDPRVKLLFVALSLSTLLLFNSLPVMACFLLAFHLILLSARIPWSRIGWIWSKMWPLTLLIFFLWPLFYPQGERVLLEFWRIRVTSAGLIQGLAMALRVNALAFAFFVLLLSTDQAKLVRGLVKLGLPFEWGLTLAIALRYLPLLYGAYTAVSEAQRARGWMVAKGSLYVRLKSYVPVLVALIITALRMMDNLSMALAARGFQPGAKRTYFRELKLGNADKVCLFALIVLFSALLTARFRCSFGA